MVERLELVQLNITDFLLARIAEDEAAARAAIAPGQLHPWGDERLPETKVSQVPNEVRGYLGGTWGEHFARHDPRRVLYECEAKRAIVEDQRRWQGWGTNDAGQTFKVEKNRTLCALALPYADHPDYDEAWRP